ncbi:putative late blight resistance protein homolog R1B-16 [Coffea eugenioides]|uniref:putative late blight resistance protein homolog R1B-16 n=1 Tax=Coffea eugenioides TaxID=49369 RepID=UPI000F609A60|nr:putative late blight resistance protein homolog R1B-16 [Coffea eugenioides]
MIYTFVHSPLWYLQWLEKNPDLNSLLKDQIFTLKQELRFMRTYLIYFVMSKGIPSESSSLIYNVEAAVIDATKDLSISCCRGLSEVGPVISHMLEKVRDCKQEIGKAYAILWELPWKFNTPPLRLSVLEFLDSVLDNIDDLLGSESLIPFIRKSVDNLKQKLNFIKNFLDITEKREVVHRKMGAFVMYAQVVATSAACLLYWCWIEKMDETRASRMDVKFSELMQLIKPCTSDHIDMYFELLKASNHRVSVKVITAEAANFVNFLLENSEASLQDQISAIREGLTQLLKFLMQLPDQYGEDVGQISTDIKVVAKKAGSFCTDKVKEDQLEEVNSLLLKLLQKITLIKEKTSQIRLQSSETIIVDEFVDVNEQLESQSTFSAGVDEQEKEDGKPLLTHCETVSRKVTLLAYSIHGNRLTEEMAIEMNHAVLILLEKIEVIKADMYMIGQEVPKADKVCLMKDQIKALHEGLKFLRKFLIGPRSIDDKIKDGKLFLAHLADVINESSSLISSFYVNQTKEDVANIMNLSILKLVGKIDFIKSELFLLELKHNEIMKGRVEPLQEGLRFLRTFLMNPPKRYKEEGELIWTKTEALANNSASVICSFCENLNEKEVHVQMNLVIPELLEKIVLLKEEIRQVYLQVPVSLHSNLPDALVFISSLLGNARTLLYRKAQTISSLKHYIEMLLAELESLLPFLLDSRKQRDQHEELQDLWTCISDVAHEAEYMIDSSVLGYDPEWNFMLWVPYAFEKIKIIKSRITEISDEKMLDIGVDNVIEMSYHPLWKAGDMVGLKDEADFLLDLLVNGPHDVDVLSIVGPSGLGKTTLARKVYHSAVVAYHFAVQAWCCVSQGYRRRDLLLDILGCIIEVTDGISGLNDDDISTVLYQCLKGRRYLIVIDNLWDTKAWIHLRELLPEDKNGSRILLTSQLRYVALQANPNSEPYPLRLLSSEESWNLLQHKTFSEENCPPGLLEVGKQISGRCKGIPLAVVLLAGILETEYTLNRWEQVSKCFRSEFFMDILEEVFEFSYRCLPDYLRPCFLYFGAFPVNQEISVFKLVRLWIAEGFLGDSELRTMEDLAERRLGYLIDRNLVTVAKRSSIGGIKACQVHDLLWNFCIQKSKEENFLQQIHGYESTVLSSAATDDPRRLCVSVQGKHFIKSRASTLATPCARCLLCSVSGDMDPKLPNDVSFISRNFKLLKILDIECINMGNSFPAGLELLELLRYLAVRGGVKSVPSWIANLWNLETLIIRGSSGEVALPYTFWYMQSLRHVDILPSVALSWQDDELEYLAPLHNMQSFSTPAISLGKYPEMLMRMIPNIRKLNYVYIPSWDNSRNCYQSPVFDCFFKLESLKISSNGKPCYPLQFNFPSTLKKLTVSRFRLPWSEASMIGKLPNLEVLKLQFRAYEGEVWEVEEDEFLKLKYLKLDLLNIVRFEACPYSFCCLERLVLHRCKRLEEIPYSLRGSETLEMIEVQSCGLSVGESVKRILQEQQAWGNFELKVVFDPKYK